MIIGHGSANPKAMFIADSPAGEDYKTNKALTGYSETTLVEFLKEQRLSLGEMYRTCLWKEKLELPKVKKEYDEFYRKTLFENDSNYYKILIEEINDLKPCLLIPLGELSFRYLTSHKGIRKFRGSILSSTYFDPMGRKLATGDIRTKVLPILGPNPYLNQEYWLRFITRIDFRKIPKYLNHAPIIDDAYLTWVCKNPTALHNFIERNKNANILYFDIETYMGIITCISLCFDGNESVCIPILDWDIDFTARGMMLSIVAKLLASNIPKVNQNIKYDWKILERFRIKVNNVVGDTMLAASCIYPEFPKNLGFLTSIYTDMPYFKDEGKEYDPKVHKREQYYLYNAKDSRAVAQIYPQQLNDLKEQGSLHIYQNLVRCMPVFRKMEDTGMLVDIEKAEELIAKYYSKFRIECQKACLLVGERFNPMSAKQCSHIVYDILGFTAAKKETTGEEELENLYVFGEAKRSPIYGKEALKIIIGCRKLHKVIEILSLCLYPDGRFRAEWNLAGTENARTTTGKCTDDIIIFNPDGKINKDSGRPVIEKEQLGYAFQNIGKHGFSIDGITYGQDVRSIFIADEGYEFCEVDLSQAEARVDAVLANNMDILSVFNSADGIHRTTGSWVYGCKPSEIKKKQLVNGVDRYHMSKTIRHAGERNMTANRLVLMTQRPKEECEVVLDTFHKFQPEIRQVFHAQIRRAVAEKRRLVAPNGRCRDFFDRITERTYNEAISTLPQQIVADQVKFSFPLIFGEDGFARKFAHLVFEAHDGFMALIRPSRRDEYIERSKALLEQPIDFNACTLSRNYQLVIPAEAAVGPRWSELKEL